MPPPFGKCLACVSHASRTATLAFPMPQTTSDMCQPPMKTSAIVSVEETQTAAAHDHGGAHYFGSITPFPPSALPTARTAAHTIFWSSTPFRPHSPPRQKHPGWNPLPPTPISLPPALFVDRVLQSQLHHLLPTIVTHFAHHRGLITPAARQHAETNSFYESEGRPSIDAMSMASPLNKSRELARAVGRERDGPIPSFRPPSNWSQHSGHQDVVWSGEGHGRISFATHDEQFSDAESWEEATHASSHAATNGDHDATYSVYGHARPSSIGSSIFAGRGVRQGGRRREAPPPLPTVPGAGRSPGLFDADRMALLSPAAQSLISPRTEGSDFESVSQYSGMDELERDGPLSPPTMTLSLPDSATRSPASPSFSPALAAAPTLLTTSPSVEFHDAQPDIVPARGSSRLPPLPVKASTRRGSSSADADSAADHSFGSSRHSSLADAEEDEINSTPRRRVLPDGTRVPKMPPVPKTDDLSQTRRSKGRRNRSPVLSFDGAAAEEEQKLSEWQEELADDPRRISTLGPRVKKNAPAPWELGGEEDLPTTSRIRPSIESFDKPFSRFKSRPSVDSSHASIAAGARSPQPVGPSGLSSGHTANSTSLEQETHEAGDDVKSLFAQQRSRSKSVSSSAVGMLKGLGLAAAAAPASRKGKLTKALRLVGGGSDDRKGAPLEENASALNAGNGLPASPISSFARQAEHSGMTKSSSSRTISANADTHVQPGAIPGALSAKGANELADMLMLSNAKYSNQMSSPPMPVVSPRLGGARSLAYTKTPLISGSSDDGFGMRHSSSKDSNASRSATTASEAGRSSAESSAVKTGTIIDSADVIERVRSSHGARGTPMTHTLSSSSAQGDTVLVRSSTPPAQPGVAMSTSSSVNSGPGLPLPGNIEGVPYKLISLEQAREQARQKQSEWLAATGSAFSPAAMRLSNSQISLNGPSTDDFGAAHSGETGNSASLRALKGKKSGFLRKLKKEKGLSVDYDGVSSFPASASSKDVGRGVRAQQHDQRAAPMPSFSVTGLDDEAGETKLGLNEMPALSVRPVSSMFSGFAADFLDAGALSEGHARDSSAGSATSLSGLLAPHSPAVSSFRSPDTNRSASPSAFEAGRFSGSEGLGLSTPAPLSPSTALRSRLPVGARSASGSSSSSSTSQTTSNVAAPVSSRPKVANIRPTPHSVALPGPQVPGSADSTWSNGRPSTSATSRLPSLDAGGSTSDGHSQFHSPVTSPLTPSFQHPQTPILVDAADGDAESTPPSTPQISEEVRQRAREIEAEMLALSKELRELRLKHVGQGIAPAFSPAGEDDHAEQPQQIGDCPYCGCGCAEQRRLQSINEAAVLKGVSVLERGRALKPSNNLGNSGKFGGYTNR
ncbi:hypothetical protein BCV70DRAFT_231572 [Testicularia cyperi]|uniref:Uncharacterized protein n=1 Tax=Testicularia cyperi TaxID=1882483 RepID=A0A317XSA0_9BASI|nr:hypothetical protein BCV70DRAFT_231572 [Testicularia cyperi]